MKDSLITNDAKSAIDKIHEFERFGSILGLERMTTLLELLGNPQDKLRVIHVAGTNGKGSVCKYIYSVLQAGGYKTGLYTSPFLEVFNERIELNGKYISDEDLAIYTNKVLECVKVMTERGEQSPTEFEVITAVSFLYFKEKKADYVVLEVGLGGKGDSTNVCKAPLATVITSISYDHTDRLGNTLAEIAAEKSGIIKDGCPVITSVQDEEALEVIRKTALEHQAMCFETKNIPYSIFEENLSGCRFTVNIQGVEYQDMEISMSGMHQVENAIAALATLIIMEERGDVVLSKENIYKGFKNAKQIGRLEVMSAEGNKPRVIIDGAHNPGGAAALKNAIKKHCAGKKILMVTGMLADKDTALLDEFTSITGDFIATEPVNPRKMDAAVLNDKLTALGAECIAVPDYKEAVLEALGKADNYDVIIFAGSLYLIGAVRTVLREKLK